MAFVTFLIGYILGVFVTVLGYVLFANDDNGGKTR